MSDRISDRLTPEELEALGSWRESELAGFDEDDVKELGKHTI